MLYKTAAKALKQNKYSTDDMVRLPAKEFYARLDKSNLSDKDKLALMTKNMQYLSNRVRPLDETKRKIEAEKKKSWLPRALMF